MQTFGVKPTQLGVFDSSHAWRTRHIDTAKIA